MCKIIDKHFVLNRYDNDQERAKDLLRFGCIVVFYYIQIVLFIIYLIVSL